VVGLGPLMIHLGFHQLQVALVAVMTGNDYSKQLIPAANIKHYLFTAGFSLWALVLYPFALTIAGLQRNILQIFNPFVYPRLWREYRSWLKPAYAIAAGAHLLALLVIFFVQARAWGLAIATVAAVLATLISFIAIGTAIERANDYAKFGE
jgi:hypothetical protein